MAKIVSQTPQNFEENVIRNVFIQVVFDVSLDRTTVSDYTVILVKNSTQGIIPGRVDYIVPTNTVTFQLFDFLDADTEYTVILVGGINGIHTLSPNEPYSDRNYVFSFTTGNSIDHTKPLAPQASYEDGPAFQGEQGIYKIVWDRTGETVSHVVTTAASVSPSGIIEPAPWNADRYLPSSGDLLPGEEFLLLSSEPEDNETGVTGSGVLFTFNNLVNSVGLVSITAFDILGFALEYESNVDNYDIDIISRSLRILPSGESPTLRYSTIYSVILDTVTDVADNEISSVELNFKTKFVPLYSTVKIIRSNLGSLISTVSDEDIEIEIYQNSKWAYENAKVPFGLTSPTVAAMNYTTCKTKLNLLYNQYLGGGQVVRKTLADLTIEYGSGLANIIAKKIVTLENCIEKNEPLLTTGYGFVTAQSAVKSYNDSRYPTWQRLVNKDFNEE